MLTEAVSSAARGMRFGFLLPGSSMVSFDRAGLARKGHSKPTGH